MSDHDQGSIQYDKDLERQAVEGESSHDSRNDQNTTSSNPPSLSSSNENIIINNERNDHHNNSNGITATVANNKDTSPSSSSQRQQQTQKHRLPLLDWITANFNWSWFTCTQSTGGIATTLSACPKPFSGILTLGTIIFLFNIFLFLLFCTFLLIRWTRDPASIRRSFTTRPECFFFGSFWLTLATMILNMQKFAVPHTGAWMLVTVRVLFWMYAAVSLLSASVHMVVIARWVPVKAVEFPAAAFILILNAMLTGTVAGDIAGDQPPDQRLPIMVAGVAYQGLGWIMCVIFLTFTIGNLLENGWPMVNLRTGLFIMVGTSSFTIVALISIARAAPMGYGYFATHPTAGEVVLILATWVGVFLWLFTFFVFLLAFMITMATVFRKEDGRWKLGLSWHNSAWSELNS